MTPGESENAQADLRAADQALRIGRLALRDGALEDATSRICYAAFNAARAALTVVGRYSKTHSGLINLFRQVHGGAEFLDSLLQERAVADYSMGEFDSTPADVEERAGQVEPFIARCRRIVEEAATEGPHEPDPPPDL